MDQMPNSREKKILLQVLKEQTKLLKPVAESVITSCTCDVERVIVTRGAHRASPSFSVAGLAVSGEVGVVPLLGGRPAVTWRV